MTITKIGSSPTSSMSIPLDRLGPPGAPGVVIVIPQFEQGGTAPDEAVLADTTPRPFVVSARLSRAQLLSDDLKGDFTEEDGGSHLLCPTDALRIETNWGKCLVKKNARGEISYVEMECVATTPADARAALMAAALPALDHLSYVHNVPLLVVQVRVHDVTHKSTHINFLAPSRTQVVTNSGVMLFDAMRPIYSMYREAKNSGSPFYQFLCYFKIMEGLFKKMRTDVFGDAKKRGVTIACERDLVPDADYFPPDLKACVGMPITHFVDTVLTKQFRTAVAHFKTDDDRVLHVSSPTELKVYADLAFVSDLCVRLVIARHENLLRQLLPQPAPAAP